MQPRNQRSSPSPDQIAQYAYNLYEKRGRVPGHELEDWLAAEKELTSAQRTPAPSPTKPAPTPGKKGSKPRMTTDMIEEGTNPWEHAAQATTGTPIRSS